MSQTQTDSYAPVTEAKGNDQMPAYAEAVRSGLYAKKSGLVGKYDNVRRYWEDDITRSFLRGRLEKLVERSHQLMRRVRIMDLGCGGADGYELLSGVRTRDPNLHQTEVDLLTPNVLETYKGVDLSADLLDQARAIHGDNPKMVFEQADFTQGLPIAHDEKPYDLYFTSCGTFSHHNDDETAVRLLADIARRCQTYCVIVCDWLGRYSYEWQTLWTNDLSENRNMDYAVSYIYEPEERQARRNDLEHLSLRLMSRAEAAGVVAAAGERAGVPIRPLEFFDRSVFTGRHMDTGDYNPHAQPIRQAVNSLHETNLRTDLSSLLIDYVPKAGFDRLNDYFEHIQMCWNALVNYTAGLLDDYDPVKSEWASPPQEIPEGFPAALRDMMLRMRRVIEGVGWLDIGLPRENIIEPQLGYALRHIVARRQQGLGAAHGLVGVFEVDKRKGD